MIFKRKNEINNPVNEIVFQDETKQLQAKNSELNNQVIFFSSQNTEFKNEIIKLKNENMELVQKLLKLEETLNWFKKQIFGQRSEKEVQNEDQLIFEGLNLLSKPEEGKNIDIPSHKRKIKNKGEDKITVPSDIPVKEQIIDIPEEQKTDPVTGKPLVKIGEEVTHKLAFEPGSYFWKKIIRPKYGLPNGEGVLTALMPDSIIPKCRLDESMLANILVKKFADHLPLYRIQEELGRNNILISEQLLSSYVVRIGTSLKPLFDELLKQILQSENIFIDETHVDILTSPKVVKGYMWTIAGGKVKNPFNRLYIFKPNHKHEHAYEILKDYKGTVHSDKLGAYKTLAVMKKYVWVPCFSHIRRKFFEAETDPPFRKLVLRKIRYLFMLERVAWNRNEEERLRIRKEKEEPVIDELIKIIKDKIENGKVLPKSKLKEALMYFYDLIPYLKNYLGLPWAHIDNNTVERAIRPITIGRKNWLFVGSEKAGVAAGVILSLVQTCRALKINPYEYLDDMLRRFMSHNAQKLNELLPDQWLKNKTQQTEPLI